MALDAPNYVVNYWREKLRPYLRMLGWTSWVLLLGSFYPFYKCWASPGYCWEYAITPVLFYLVHILQRTTFPTQLKRWRHWAKFDPDARAQVAIIDESVLSPAASWRFAVAWGTGTICAVGPATIVMSHLYGAISVSLWG